MMSRKESNLNGPVSFTGVETGSLEKNKTDGMRRNGEGAVNEIRDLSMISLNFSHQIYLGQNA